MKKFLPISFAVLFCFVSLGYPMAIARAATPVVPPAGLWVVDPEVTFIGKNAARSGYTLNWTLQNYQWVCVTKVAASNCDNTGNPLAQFWWTIVLYIVFPLLIVVILATAMIIIITRGRSLTIMRFIPRFTSVLILIALSYALLQFLYQFTDLIQGFFLRSGTTPCPPDCISNKDLLYVGWNYQDFTGLRLLGDYNAESAFISLLLTKLTALTYYVMVGILLIRKIILWFFIIVSPIFPLLLLYYPVRNTGKIWIGEFFRWLLYGPLFAIFLQGLVFMWRQAIPLQFGNSAIQDPAKIIYPTAVNILLGGPRQFVTPNNSVNLTETFMLYVVALIMLWIVILLPWILLQIFLEYASNFSGDNAMMKNFVTLVSNKMIPPPAPIGGHPAPQPGSIGLTLPFTKKTVNIPILTSPGGAAKEIIKQSQLAGVQSSTATYPVSHAQINAEVISFANIPLPTMRDIARYETAQLSNSDSQKQEVTRMSDILEKIANPNTVASLAERERYSSMNERIVRESTQGNIIATTILNAINSVTASQANKQYQSSIQATDSHLRSILQQIANPALTSSKVDHERMSQIHDMLSRESKEKNNQLASSILSVSDRTTATELDKIRDQLVKERAAGNPVASTITNAIKASQLKNIMSQIANPASVASATEREKMSKLHDMLSRESKENNNQLASSILQVKDTTTLAELERISEKLQQTKDSSLSSQVLSGINSSLQQAQNMTKVKSVLQAIANPAMSSGVDKQKLDKLHDALTRESHLGNELATNLLAINEKTSTADIEKLNQKLNEAKEKGQSLATDILTVAAQQANINVPSTNRIQAVTSEELQEVKTMWKENYQNMEIPQGMAGTRSGWIKDDIDKIDNLVGLLSSQDQEQINQGLSEVANILPFLLVGGFSQSEIVSYLATKQEAAKEVLESIKSEEETKISIETKQVQAPQTMAVKIEAPSVEVSAPSVTAANLVTPQVTNEILAMVNLKLPRMRDVARFESMSLSRDKSKMVEVEKVRETLEKIANPSTVSVATEREKFEKLRSKLMEESQKGNLTAETIIMAGSVSSQTLGELTASLFETKTILQHIADPALSEEDNHDFYTRLHDYLAKEDKESSSQLARKVLSVTAATSPADIESIKSQLLKEQKENKVASEVIHAINEQINLKQIVSTISLIADPEKIISPVGRERFRVLHDELLQSDKAGNPLAKTILAVSPSAKTKDILRLKDDLSAAMHKNDPLANSILSALGASNIPTENRTQSVTQNDYLEIEKMWEENYRTLPVPFGFSDDQKGRIEWITKDIEEIQLTVSLLQGSDTSKKNEGLQKVKTILPFLLLGGFSYQEIIAYLKVKLTAANTVLAELSLGEEKEEKVDVNSKKQEKPKVMAAEEENGKVNK